MADEQRLPTASQSESMGLLTDEIKGLTALIRLRKALPGHGSWIGRLFGRRGSQISPSLRDRVSPCSPARAPFTTAPSLASFGTIAHAAANFAPHQKMAHRVP